MVEESAENLFEKLLGSIDDQVRIKFFNFKYFRYIKFFVNYQTFIEDDNLPGDDNWEISFDEVDGITFM